jgi:hypothetical protein
MNLEPGRHLVRAALSPLAVAARRQSGKKAASQTLLA